MGLRFHRQIRLGRLAHINLSKTGASLSLGWAGRMLNLNRRGIMGTIGAPGTGASWRTRRRPWPWSRR